jgi:hypothetical protein
MTQNINLTALRNWILYGATFALILTSVFLITAGEGDPSWPKYWMARPLIIVPLAGAGGGAFFYFMTSIRVKTVWQKLFIILLGLIGYIVAFWLGGVLGLDGTWWD